MATQATYTLVSPPTPGLEPPAGVIPTFHQPYTLLPYAEVTIALCGIITTFLVAARLYVKIFILKKLLWEDFTCILGWLTYLVFCALNWRGGVHGAGTHQWNLTIQDVQYFSRLSNVADMFVCIAYGNVKVSILLLILRIFVAVKRKGMFWFTQFWIFANAIYYSVAFFINIFACRPRRKIWITDTHGECFDISSLYISSAVFNTVSDVAILSIPLIMVWQLQMSTKRKLGISVIFGTGVFATICAIVRIYFQMKLLHSKDYTFVHIQTGLLGNAELGCGIICCCLPLLPLFSHHLSQSSSGSGAINLGDMAHNGQTKRSVHESYEPNNSVKAGNWVKLDDGTMTPMPKVHGVARAPSDDQALAQAIAGV